MTIDIKSVYSYYNNEKDVSNLTLKNCFKSDNLYKCDNYLFELYDDKLIVTSDNQDVKYEKKYVLNKKIISKLEVNNCIFYTQLETIFFKRTDNKINLIAREYTESNEFLNEVNIELTISN